MNSAELIARLEKAVGPDRELDAAVFEAVNGVSAYSETPAYRQGGQPVRRMMTIPSYTESMDAALSLFGEHMPRGLNLYRNSAPDMGGKDWVISHQSPTRRVAARSWPLAICIAALKAKETT